MFIKQQWFAFSFVSKHFLFSSCFPETLHYNAVYFFATGALTSFPPPHLLINRNLMWVTVLTKVENKLSLDYGISYKKLLRSLMILWMNYLFIWENWERAKATQLVFLLHPICRQQYCRRICSKKKQSLKVNTPGAKHMSAKEECKQTFLRAVH